MQFLIIPYYSVLYMQNGRVGGGAHPLMPVRHIAVHYSRNPERIAVRTLESLIFGDNKHASIRSDKHLTSCDKILQRRNILFLNHRTTANPSIIRIRGGSRRWGGRGAVARTPSTSTLVRGSAPISINPRAMSAECARWRPAPPRQGARGLVHPSRNT